jgi:putative spermidine/putrescine transport system substrate-binding protein
MRFQGHRISAVVLIAAALIAASCSRSGPETDPRSLSRDKLVQAAKGGTVRFAMWGGDERINGWIDTFVASRMKELYGVTVERTPMDAAVFITKLSNEKKAGKTDGSLDLVWINGENFARAKREGLLFGPYTEKMENWKYVDPESVSLDFGVPVEGYEAPYGKAQFVFEYDSAKISGPPGSFRELGEWVKKNPGRFTYPQPPDFTGSAFIRQAFYEIGGGYEPFLTPGNTGEFEKRAALLYAWLSEIKPYLWQQGRSYPATKANLDGMFERGEVDLNMSYTQSGAQGRIEEGTYPKTVRTFVMKKNSLSNYHFTAIPFNAPNKAGAMLLSDFLLSPEVQLSKNDPAVWGDFTVLDMGRLEEKDRATFRSLDLGEATLDLETLGANAVPEILPEYLLLLDKGWETQVLRAK